MKTAIFSVLVVAALTTVSAQAGSTTESVEPPAQAGTTNLAWQIKCKFIRHACPPRR